MTTVNPTLARDYAAPTMVLADQHAHSSEPQADFDALFASLIIKEMRKTLGEGGLFPGDKGDVLGGLWDEILAKHLGTAFDLGFDEQLAFASQGGEHNVQR